MFVAHTHTHIRARSAIDLISHPHTYTPFSPSQSHMLLRRHLMLKSTFIASINEETGRSGVLVIDARGARWLSQSTHFPLVRFKERCRKVPDLLEVRQNRRHPLVVCTP